MLRTDYYDIVFSLNSWVKLGRIERITAAGEFFVYNNSLVAQKGV